MDWSIFVDFGNVWYWVVIGSGLLGAWVARLIWGGTAVGLRVGRAIDTRLAELEHQAAGLVKRAEQLSRSKEDADTYEAMLHRNYHIRQHFGPVPGCPHCPQKEPTA